MLDLATLLAAAGWLRTGVKIARAIKEYAAWHRIPLGPGLEERVAKHAALPRCGRPDILSASAELRAWPDGRITAHQAIAIPGMTAAQIAGAWRNALARIQAVCGIAAEPAAPKAAARIVAASGRLDGPGSVLAQSEMPGPGIVQCQQWYDDTEPWATYGDRSLEDTMLHEIGHAMGLDHSQDPEDYMYPIMRFGTGPALGPGDIHELRARYGPPVVSPQPQPPSPQPGPRELPPIGVAVGEWPMKSYVIEGGKRVGIKARLALVFDGVE